MSSIHETTISSSLCIAKSVNFQVYYNLKITIKLSATKLDKQSLNELCILIFLSKKMLISGYFFLISNDSSIILFQISLVLFNEFIFFFINCFRNNKLIIK